MLNQLWELSKEIFGRIGSSLTGVIFSAVEEAKNSLLSLLASVQAIINRVEEQVQEILSKIVNSIKDTISDAIDGIKAAFTGLLDTVKTVLTQIWESAKEIFDHIGTALKEALTPDLDKWGKKLNPVNWFSDDADEKKKAILRPIHELNLLFKRSQKHLQSPKGKQEPHRDMSSLT